MNKKCVEGAIADIFGSVSKTVEDDLKRFALVIEQNCSKGVTVIENEDGSYAFSDEPVEGENVRYITADDLYAMDESIFQLQALDEHQRELVKTIAEAVLLDVKDAFKAYPWLSPKKLVKAMLEEVREKL